MYKNNHIKKIQQKTISIQVTTLQQPCGEVVNLIITFTSSNIELLFIIVRDVHVSHATDPSRSEKTKGFLFCALTTLGVNASQALIPTPKMLSHANPIDLSFIHSENSWWQCLVDCK